MLVAKVLPWIQQSMQGRKFSDDEIKEDVDFLADELKSSFDGMTLVAAPPSWPPHSLYPCVAGYLTDLCACSSFENLSSWGTRNEPTGPLTSTSRNSRAGT